MITIILSGGKSSRMGKDKGLTIYHQKPLVSYAIDQSQRTGMEPFIYINIEYLNLYSQFIPSGRILYDDPNSSVEGPLKGIVSAITKFPGHDFLFLSV